MILSNLHTHSKFCDGKDTPRELVERAIELGFSSLGFSSHACYVSSGVCPVERFIKYRKEISALKEEYKDKIEIYCAIEEEIHTPFDRTKYDYIIGSQHFVKKSGKYYAIDLGYDRLIKLISRFKGNKIAFAEKYYSDFLNYIFNRKPDIIGHFDLLTMYDEKYEPLFLGDKEYIALSTKAIEKASMSGAIFEVNTGAMCKGYRTSFYPAPYLLETLKKNEAKILLSSDCHDKNFLDGEFKKSIEIIKDIGFKKLSTIKGGKFVEYNI